MWNKLEYKDFKNLEKWCHVIDCKDNTLNPLFLTLWRKVNNLEYLEEEKWFLLKGEYEGSKFIFRPLCKVEDTIEALQRAKSLLGDDITLAFANDRTVNGLITHFDEVKVIGADPSEYIYSTTEFLTFSGRKMQKKRNHLNNFIRRHHSKKVEVKELKDEKMEDVIVFLEKWAIEHRKNNTKFFELEYKSNIEALKQYKHHESKGLVVRIDGEVKAFSMVTTACDLGVYNIEKADGKIRGLYQFLQKETANKYWNKPGIKWISREDDAGDETLKKSKDSYKPVYMARRRTVKWK